MSVAIRIVERGLRVPMATFFAGEADETADDLARLAALMVGQPPAIRRLALKILRALVEE